jgi:hypothetical protein
MNSRKGVHEDVLDPFTIAQETFVLDFTTFRPEPGPNLSQKLVRETNSTIRRLKLDDDICVGTRIEWLELFSEKELTLSGLKKRAPFLAYEIERQSLSAAGLRKIFRRPKNSSS